jgi:hypothetical protein
MTTPSERFAIANEMLGWGDPQGGAWFIGLEEASVWNNDNLPQLLALQGESYVSETKWNWKELGASGRGIRDYTSKIVQPLSQSHRERSWKEYRDEKLWGQGSKVFQSNLYPLGKPSLKDWPEHYGDLFGFGLKDRERYREVVRKTRFPLIQRLRERQCPQAVVCFGVYGWEDFQDMLGLDRASASWPDEDVAVFSQERVILTPFLGQGMSNEKAAAVTKQLLEWSVFIS